MAYIEYTKQSHIAIFTNNNPKALGAFTKQSIFELHDALVDFRDDPNLLAGILTGTGDKAFCVGVDINDFLPFAKSVTDKPWMVPGSLMRRLEIWKPVIAALNGLTYGGGLEMALGCDIRIAVENAKFAFPEATLGIFIGGGGTQRLPKIIPRGLAMEMLFTGKPIDAAEAYRIGLINKIVSQDQLMPIAIQMAETICKNGPLAIQAIKEAVIRGNEMSLDDGLRLEEYFNRLIMSTQDFAEGTSSFLQKRKPNFQGK